jgi:drug/metabolite transporter (DMT)-like permease
LAFGLPHERPHWTLYLGILFAAIGAALVLFSKEYAESLHATAKPPQESGWMWILFVVMAGLCWGTYVPLIAQGGKELKNSYASFLCVGVAYFLIAVLIPVIIMSIRGSWPIWTSEQTGLNRGAIFATLSGTAGAIGALCVIFATFEFKGPKIFVAPLIFALAPVINTVFSLFWHPTKEAFFGMPDDPPHWTFYIGIVCAGLGAGLVLFSKEYVEWKHAVKAGAAKA